MTILEAYWKFTYLFEVVDWLLQPRVRVSVVLLEMKKEKLRLNCALCNGSQVRRDAKRNLIRGKASEAELGIKQWMWLLGPQQTLLEREMHLSWFSGIIRKHWWGDIIPSHLISSHHISSHLILSYLISSHLISFHLIWYHLISYHLISSHTISAHPINFNISHFISSHPMLCYVTYSAPLVDG